MLDASVSPSPSWPGLHSSPRPEPSSNFGMMCMHIIPKFDDGSGLGLEWSPGQLGDGETLASSIADAIE